MQRRQLSVIAMVAAIAVTAGRARRRPTPLRWTHGSAPTVRPLPPARSCAPTLRCRTRRRPPAQRPPRRPALRPTRLRCSPRCCPRSPRTRHWSHSSPASTPSGSPTSWASTWERSSSCGLTPDQITAVAQGVLASTPAVRQDLLSGAPDPAVLLGLLAGSLDLQSLTDGTIATLVQGLISAITGTRIVVSPELTLDLGKLLGDLATDKLGPIVANPSDTSFVGAADQRVAGVQPAVHTSSRLANPQLDPALRSLLDRAGDTERLDRRDGARGPARGALPRASRRSTPLARTTPRSAVERLDLDLVGRGCRAA